MQGQPRSNPFAYFFLVLPYGISNGFVSIMLLLMLRSEPRQRSWRKRAFAC